MKVDNDIIEQIKIICLFILQSYKILMGTMITLFIPQKCFYNQIQYNPIFDSNNLTIVNQTVQVERLCSFNENLDNLDSGVFSLNCITGLMFLVLYFIEIRREYWLIEHFDIDHNLSDNNLDNILNINDNEHDYKPLKRILYKYNNVYFNFVLFTSLIFIVNNIFAISIIVDKNYGSTSFNTYLGFLILIMIKLYNSMYISYVSKKNHRAMSSFMTEFSSFNIIDKDVAHKYKKKQINTNRP